MGRVQGRGKRGRGRDTGDALTVFPEEASTKQTEVVQQRVVSDLIVLHEGFGAREGCDADQGRNTSCGRRALGGPPGKGGVYEAESV